MRETERQQAFIERAVGRRLLAPDANPPSPSSISPFFSSAWRSPPRRSGSRSARRSAPCATPRMRPRCRARARSCGSAGTAPCARSLVRQHVVFLRAAPRVFVPGLEHHIGAEREMMRHARLVAVNRGDDFGHAGFAACRPMLSACIFREVETDEGGNESPSGCGEAGGVAHRRHLDAGFGAIDERVEHFLD